MNAFANLHTHTYFSDGAAGPADLVRSVYAQGGLECFALTDHDTLSGVEPVFRLQSRMASSHRPLKRFIPGIELSLREGRTGLTVHIIGLFPHVKEGNLQETLGDIDVVLGEFCRERSRQRGLKDLDYRVKKAFTLNLDGLGEQYDSPEQVIGLLRDTAREINRSRFAASQKRGDVIQHPIPVTYQILLDCWEEIVPASSREKITLYTLRQEREKVARLTGIYLSEGMDEAKAGAAALKNQGVLARFDEAVIPDKGILEGLELLHRAGAVSILAHPAVDHRLISYDDYDHHVLYPLIARGLEGIEVFYPYDQAYRDEAISRYHAIAGTEGLLISGGTDFHGDGRTGIADVRLPIEEAERIIGHK